MENETDTEFLARMMAEGFMVLQESINKALGELGQVRMELDELRKEIRTINKRLDEYFTPMLDDHARRIKDLELARN